MTISLSCAALLYALLSAPPLAGNSTWQTFSRTQHAKMTKECSEFVTTMEKKKGGLSND